MEQEKLKSNTGDKTPLPWIPSIMKYPKNPKEIYTGIQVKLAADYCAKIFDTILPDSDKDYIKDHLIIKANVEYACKACNLFPELIEALEQMTYIVGEAKDGREIWLNNEGWNNFSKAKELIQKAKS